MFSKLALFAAATMAVFVAAAPGVPPATTNVIENSCNSGTIQCCNQQFSSDSDETALLSNIVGAGPITGQGGITCTPVTVIGASGTSCSSQPVCCNDNDFSHLTAIFSLLTTLNKYRSMGQ